MKLLLRVEMWVMANKEIRYIVRECPKEGTFTIPMDTTILDAWLVK